MGTIWFWLVAIMIAVYVLLDGFDLGAGAIHLLVAKTDEERRQVLASIGPVWDGNEVWLIAAGGTLYFAFPALYASSFSGFYLPLDDRAVAAHFARHLDRVSQPRQERSVGSVVGFHFLRFQLAAGRIFRRGARQRGARRSSRRQRVFLRTAVDEFSARRRNGNSGLVHDSGRRAALLAVLVMHGALVGALKTSGPVSERAARLARQAWWGVFALTAIVTAVTFKVQPQVKENLTTWPLGTRFSVAGRRRTGRRSVRIDQAGRSTKPSSRPARI